MMMPTSILIVDSWQTRLLAAQALERLPNRFRIVEPSHQFTDVLLLASQSATFPDTPRLENRFEQILVERYRPQVGVAQHDQLLTELLQGQVGAFPRAFTGLCFVHRLKYLPRSTRDPGGAVYHARNTSKHGNTREARIAES